MLHDTYGFPLEVTTEITAERGVEVDIDGFNAEMTEQRVRAKAARKAGGGADDERVEQYREIVEHFGITEFVGYEHDAVEARVLAVVPAADGTVEVFLDRSPFYAESGGQVGDSGTITTDTGVVRASGTARSPCPVCAGTSAPWTPARSRPVKRRGRRSTSKVEMRRAATTRRPTCCTGRCATCSAST